MFKKIRKILLNKRLSSIDLSDLIVVAPHNTVQEDTNCVKARVRRMFEAQKHEMEARLRVAHGTDCANPDICIKNPCWVFNPDKMIDQSVEEIAQNRRVNMGMGNFKDK